MINFPRPTKRVGKCLAIVCDKIKNGSKRYAAGDLIIYNRPIVRFNKEPWTASRLSYCLNVKFIPRNPPTRKKGLILHTCDHEWCIEPKHLYLGTMSQNSKDMHKRHPTKDKHHSEIMKGRESCFKNHNHTEETKKILSLLAKKQFSSRIERKRLSLLAQSRPRAIGGRFV